jgi:hypoxanthine phosphoribosyltransferase
MVMADLARELHIPIEIDWMAVSSYGQSTQSSGVVRIVKDLDISLEGRDVIIVEDIVDSGLTLSWLLENFSSRQAATIKVAALLRKPDAMKVDVTVDYLGFDIANDFVVGFGLDYAESYRNLRGVGVLKPSVYST